MQLKEIRTRSGRSQKDIAERLGVTVATYSRYETGDREPDLKMLVRLSEEFGVTVGCLVGTEPIPEDYGTAAGSSAPAPNQPAAKKAPAAQQGQSAPFSQEQLRYLDAWKKDLAREVADLIQEDISSSSGQAGGA